MDNFVVESISIVKFKSDSFIYLLWPAVAILVLIFSKICNFSPLILFSLILIFLFSKNLKFEPLYILPLILVTWYLIKWCGIILLNYVTAMSYINIFLKKLISFCFHIFLNKRWIENINLVWILQSYCASLLYFLCLLGFCWAKNSE
jgi:hypothetical protein